MFEKKNFNEKRIEFELELEELDRTDR